eukprot:1591728-Ditylum_brightwellii.AAC.1
MTSKLATKKRYALNTAACTSVGLRDAHILTLVKLWQKLILAFKAALMPALANMEHLKTSP